MRLARDLWSVYNLKLYTNWGFDTFDSYVRDEVGISKDRAYRLRRIFSHFIVKCGVRPDALEGVGRSAAEKLLPVVTRDNAHEWITKAKSLPYGKLMMEVSEITTRQRTLRGAASVRTVDQEPQDNQPVKLVPMGSSESPRVEQEHDPEEFSRRVFFLPPDADALLDEALGEAQRTTRSDSENWNLTCVLLHFVAHRLTNEGKDDGRLRWFMRNMERVYGVRLIRIKDDAAWEVLRGQIEEHPELFGTSEIE